MRKIITVFVGFVALFAFVLYLHDSNGCELKEELKTVRGSSMYPLISEGDVVKALFGYYECYEIKRGDIILYQYTGNENLLIKSIKGVPGDSFQLQREDKRWYILVNGEILRNSEEDPYFLHEGSEKMIALYEENHEGVIPKGAYLLFGDNTQSALDSSRFGLVGKGDILAKVEVK